jgi:hypothetical protein
VPAWERARRKRPILNRVRLMLAISAMTLPVLVLGLSIVGGRNASMTFGPHAGPTADPEVAGLQPPPRLPAPTGDTPDRKSAAPIPGTVLLTARPPIFAALRVTHHRVEPSRYLGELGATSFRTQFDDDVRVQLEFKVPLHCYLVALNPDGREQLCHPADETIPPPRTSKRTYPASETAYFALTDGVGCQAFALLAAVKPLPAYRDWKKTGALPWRPAYATGVWQFDGAEYKLLVPTVRGAPRERANWDEVLLVAATTPAAPVPWGALYVAGRGGPPRALVELGEALRGRPDLDAVRVLAFPVGPKQ